MAAQVNDLVRDIKTDNKDEVTKEIDRVQAMFRTKKSNLTKTMNKITELRTAISDGTSDVVSDPHEGNINIVTKFIIRLDKCNSEFELVHERLDTLHNYLTALDKSAAEKGLKNLDVNFEEYNSNYNDTSINIVKIQSDQEKEKAMNTPQTNNSANTSTNSSSQKAWKPNDWYKPSSILQSPDEVNLQQLDDWIDRLKAYLDGHHTENIKNINIIVGDLIHKDVKGAVNFDSKATIPIFTEKPDGTKQENSLESKIREYWDGKNPLSKLRSKAFGLHSKQYEKFDQWKDRAKQALSRADLHNITAEAIEGLIVLMNFHGPHCEEIRKRSIDKFKEGDITVSDIEQIAHEIEMAEALNEKEDADQLNRLDSKGTRNKNDNKKRTLHPYQQKLAKEGKCFACAYKHERGKCKNEKFNCNFCKKDGHTKKACYLFWDQQNQQKGKESKPNQARPLTEASEESSSA